MRTSGILMHISSLWSEGGIGTLGKEAYHFVDFLKRAGQTYWQILPIGPTSYGDSPYQSFSAFAGNPYFVDLEMLEADGLIKAEEWRNINCGENTEKVDYEKLYNHRYRFLSMAFERFTPDNDYKNFCKENSFWLDDYALFMTIKSANNGKCFYEWEEKFIKREKAAIENFLENNSKGISFWKFVQYKFFEQWKKLKSYANSNGIKIIGDLPIYIALDSADLWANPENFALGEDLSPSAVAGVPPDAFSEDGQLWGNPLYNWSAMKKDNYAWFKQRFEKAFELYDTVRIDHFRAFASYYAIPFGEETAKNGKWKKGPGMSLFRELKSHFGELPIIAEDLGVLTEDVTKLLKSTGFPGMKILQFAFDSREDSDYLPHNFCNNCVVYIGTHDNDTAIGWLSTAPTEDVAFCKKYLNLNENEGYNWQLIKAAMGTVADTCIITMQDLLGLSSEARMNTPSTLSQNWQWRVKGECINDWLADILLGCTTTYRRNSKN